MSADMRTPADAGANTPVPLSTGLGHLAWLRLRRDRLGMSSLIMVAAFFILTLGTAAGWIAADWGEVKAPSNASPGRHLPPVQPVVDPSSAADPSPIVDPLAGDLAEIAAQTVEAAGVQAVESWLPLGADRWGRDVLAKVLKGTQTSLWVGVSAALVAVFIGTLLGALAGYWGGRIDDALNWFYSVLTSMPYLMLILAIAAVLNQKGTLTVVLILGLTGWTGIFRLVRAEYMKQRVREYVRAAESLGASHARRMFGHILPNISHVLLVQLSLHVVSFMKSEVVLSFLGFGVAIDDVSWGSMLNESQSEVLLGNWWQLAAATVAMALLVTAFSLLTDALRDAMDPRLAHRRAD